LEIKLVIENKIKRIKNNRITKKEMDPLVVVFSASTLLLFTSCFSFLHNKLFTYLYPSSRPFLRISRLGSVSEKRPIIK